MITLPLIQQCQKLGVDGVRKVDSLDDKVLVQAALAESGVAKQFCIIAIPDA